MDETTIHFSIYPPRTLLDQFRTIAKSRSRSASGEMVELMKQYVKRAEKRSRQTKNEQ
jgi:hypothetical protein